MCEAASIRSIRHFSALFTHCDSDDQVIDGRSRDGFCSTVKI